MRKIHITLVGGQPAPVYNGIVATNPDVVVYIFSDSTKSVVNKLREEIHILEDIQEPLDTTDPNIIMERVSSLQKRYSDDVITLNISGGLKSWSHLFGREFEKMPNATVIYMDQNNVMWNYRTMNGTADFQFDIYTLFRLYGNPIENHYTDIHDYNIDDVESLKRIERIYGSSLHKEFTDLLSTLDRPKQRSLAKNDYGVFESQTGSGSYVEWEKKSKESEAYVHISLSSHKRHIDTVIESAHAIELAFNSGWFEYKIARLISGWNRAKKVFMNCHFPFDDIKDKNEVDIIADIGNKVLFVECKTQISNTTDIDKFHSVVKNYGGTGSKALFITAAKMTDMASHKCHQYDIIPFSLDGEHPVADTDKALYNLLESKLSNINAL